MSTVTPAAVPLDDLLQGFSQSIRGVFAGVEFEEVTVWQLGRSLTAALDRFAQGALVGQEGAGEARPRWQWLVLVRGLFAWDEISRRLPTSPEVDERLFLLALGRLDSDFEHQLRRSGARWKFEDELELRLSDALLPWVKPVPPSPFSIRAAVNYDGVPAHKGAVRDCAFSPTGGLRATVGDDGKAVISDVASGDVLRFLEGHKNRIRRCDFSPDGSLLATASDDGAVMVWDPVSGGTPLVELPGSAGVRTCAFSPVDGGLLASAHQDGTLRLWAVPSGREQAALSGHKDEVRHCAFSAGVSSTCRSRPLARGAPRLWRFVACRHLSEVLTLTALR